MAHNHQQMTGTPADSFVLAPPSNPPNHLHQPSTNSTSAPRATSATNVPSAPNAPQTQSSRASPAPITTRPARASTGPPGNHGGPHICPDCQRQYSRPEHLARHIQTHTLGKRFPCPICGKAFARTDLLRRHTQNHQNNDGTKKRRTGSSAFSAGRVSHACKQCSTARVKCEEVKPCTRCRTRNLTCDYNANEAALAHHNPHMKPAPVAQQPLPPLPPVSQISTGMAPGQHHGQHTQHGQYTMQGVVQNQSTLAHMPPPPPSIQQAMNANDPSYNSSSPSNSSPAGSSYTQGTPNARMGSYGNSPMSQQQTPNRRDDASLPTPDALDDHQHINQAVVTMNYSGLGPALMTQPVMTQPVMTQPVMTQNNMVVDMAHLPFTDFLRDIIYEPDLNANHTLDVSTFPILDFCTDANLELNETDYGLLDYLNLNLELPQDDEKLSSGEEAANLIKVRRELASMWTHDNARCAAEAEDNCWTGGGNTSHLDVGGLADCKMPAMEESRRRLYSVVSDKVSFSGRDGVLAMILATCKNPTMIGRVSSSFPSLEALDGFVHIFLASHLCQVSNFIHFPSLRLKDQVADWTASTVAAGAVITPVPTIRRFGYAVQEAVRIATALRLESSSQPCTDLSIVQAIIFLQDAGLWSSNRAKMVAAESYLGFPIHIMRCRGKFQRSQYPLVQVNPSDEGNVLEEKWKLWYTRESWKRLIFHCYLRDCQVSIMSMTNPVMSYYELSLPLPESQELWFAKSATEWKNLYLKLTAGYTKRPPCVGDLLRDITILTANIERLDVQFSVSIYLAGMWTLIHEYHQLSGVQRSRSFTARNLAGNSNTLLSERHQELYKELRTFQQMRSLRGAISPQQSLMLHLLMMQLHISVGDIFMFSGRGGEDQMRRAYPILKQWSESTEAREALWHAAQTLRYAKMFPPGLLRDFWCVATFQAGVTFWTYGVVTGASRKRRRDANLAGVPRSSDSDGSFNGGAVPHIPGRIMNEPLFLDGEDGTAVMRYLSMGQGQPFIRGPVLQNGGRSDSALQASPDDPAGCMEIIGAILAANHGSEERYGLPALVYNLRALTKQLATVAQQVHA